MPENNRFIDTALEFDAATGEIIDSNGAVIARVEYCEQVISNQESEQKAVRECNEESEQYGRLFAEAPKLLAFLDRCKTIFSTMPKPRIGQWDWPYLRKEADDLIKKIEKGEDGK